MRRSWVYFDGIAYEKGAHGVQARTQIVPDFDKPYKSMVTGEMITSRAKHREHLKRHNMVEVGNDPNLRKVYKGIPDTNPKGRKELLIAQVNAMTHEQFKAAGKRDLDNLRWNSRDIPDPLKSL